MARIHTDQVTPGMGCAGIDTTLQAHLATGRCVEKVAGADDFELHRIACIIPYKASGVKGRPVERYQLTMSTGLLRAAQRHDLPTLLNDFSATNNEAKDEEGKHDSEEHLCFAR